jgi:hypothetical protein
MVPSGALPKSIRKFLDSCDSELKIERCQDCGFLMELKSQRSLASIRHGKYPCLYVGSVR